MKMVPGIHWLFWAMIAFGAAGWALTAQAAYAYLFYAGAFLMVGSYLWAVRSLRGIQLKRRAFSLRASVGDIFEEYYEVDNTSWQPCVWLEIHNRSDLPGDAGSRLLTNIGSYHKRTYLARTRLLKRGAYPLGPVEMASGDPLGIFSVRRVEPAKETLIVLPMTVDIPVFTMPPGILPGGKAIRQKTADITPHVAGIREYVPDDPFRKIHWPSTARRNRLMVKEFEQDPQAEIWFFVDSYRDAHIKQVEQIENEQKAGKGWWLQWRTKFTLPKDTFEYTICAVASLARHFLQEKRVVGLASASARYTFLPAERGDRQTDKILEALAFLKPDGELPLHGLITMQARLLPIGSGVIVVTPSAHRDLLIGVDHLQRCNLKPVVILIRGDTFGDYESADALKSSLLERKVPVCEITYGVDMALQLGNLTTLFRRPTLPDSALYLFD